MDDLTCGYDVTTVLGKVATSVAGRELGAGAATNTLPLVYKA